MVQKFLKFIAKSPHKDLFLKVISDIYENNLWKYDIKPLIWQKWYYRIRIWTVRFVYKTSPTWNKIIDVNNRGDLY